MSAADDGGAAFPCEGGPESGLHPDPGMSLRDYFAGQAPEPPKWWMDSWVSAHFPLPTGAMIWNGPTDADRIRALGDWAYIYADAMLAARSRGRPE